MKSIITLTETNLRLGLDYLETKDPDLGTIVHNLGAPPMWARKPGFPTLLLIILEQQVSLASAKAAFTKLTNAISFITPENFIELSDSSLKEIGFSRQKIAYCRGLAHAVATGSLILDDLNELNDDSAREKLVKIKGIGPWTANIYLLMALLRPDIWPSGDLAIAEAVKRVKHLPERPNPLQLDEIGSEWQPWRSVAARILWNYYLNTPRNIEK